MIVGCGNIGSRHLQALTKLPFVMRIDIVEPNKDAQTLAKLRLNEIPYDATKINFVWHESIKELKNESDIVIVATNAAGRVDIINQLLESGHSRFLVEKVVCQSTDEYNLLLSKLKSFNAKGWVNTNRRYFQTYQKIKEFFENSKIIHLSVIAGNIGLGTNAIHYIDLFSWLVNDNKIKLNGEFLINKLFPNKRGKDFVEFAGTIIGATNADSSLTLTSLPYDNMPSIVNIVTENKNLMIDETNEKILDLINRNDHHFEYKFEHASSLTTKIVMDILEKDDCLLPTINDLSHAHKELFRTFNAHIKKVINEERKLCPIT